MDDFLTKNAINSTFVQDYQTSSRHAAAGSPDQFATALTSLPLLAAPHQASFGSVQVPLGADAVNADSLLSSTLWSTQDYQQDSEEVPQAATSRFTSGIEATQYDTASRDSSTSTLQGAHLTSNHSIPESSQEQASSAESQPSDHEQLDALSADEDDFAESVELAVDLQPSAVEHDSGFLSSAAAATQPGAASNDRVHAAGALQSDINVRPADQTVPAQQHTQADVHLPDAVPSGHTADNLSGNISEQSAEHQSTRPQPDEQRGSSPESGSPRQSIRAHEASQQHQETPELSPEQNDPHMPQSDLPEDASLVVEPDGHVDQHKDLNTDSMAAKNVGEESAMAKAEQAERRLLTGKPKSH